MQPHESRRRKFGHESPPATKADNHPSVSRWNRPMQSIRNTSLILYFVLSTICIHILQWVGAPLRFCHLRWYCAWQAAAKESYALVLLSLNAWCSPGRTKISGDSSVRGQIRKGHTGNVTFDFPKRIVLIANHQIYTDWIYLWWAAYAAHHHGHLIVVLKESFQKIPIFGRGMKFFSWVFLSRHWETDRSRLHASMRFLSNTKGHDSMWLLIFPEGTNLSENTHKNSRLWGEKVGATDLKHTLLPRTRGLQLCLQGLGNSVDWLYDCTIAYGDIPPGEYGQDIYTLKSLYVDGRKAPVANIHWRRFAVKDIPLNTLEDFDQWLLDRWTEKDRLIAHYESYGQFPADDGYIETEVRLHHPFANLRVFGSILAGFVILWTIKWILWAIILGYS